MSSRQLTGPFESAAVTSLAFVRSTELPPIYLRLEMNFLENFGNFLKNLNLPISFFPKRDLYFSFNFTFLIKKNQPSTKNKIFKFIPTISCIFSQKMHLVDDGKGFRSEWEALTTYKLVSVLHWTLCSIERVCRLSYAVDVVGHCSSCHSGSTIIVQFRSHCRLSHLMMHLVG